MNKTKILRGVLLIGALFNVTAALMVAYPTTIGKLAELPEPGTTFYTLMLSSLVGIFGAVYSWLAFQQHINRPLLTVAAIGKTDVFLVSLYCWQADIITFRGFSLAIGDLIFAMIFFWWLFTESKSDPRTGH
jgi:hypothetical protein